MHWIRNHVNFRRGRSLGPARVLSNRNRIRTAAAGITLIELIIACSILMVLATAALPLARNAILRRKEAMLRYDLRQMRDAIDRYKDAADQNKIQVQAGTEGYPPDLETLVNGVALNGAQDKRVHFLREIPVDPMTGSKDWGMRSVQDDPTSMEWGGTDVFNVFSRSTATALDGSKYSDW
ncbi:MAG TPA: prepilin-type N-terminal cleavage/methylation domain-containing protein [Candidatus Acidoferrum sp.]|nr:prepilin-type N-terminal cleavage/methylation domain-containing protein [Candidatus Acidoferrum sp.]